MSVRKLHASFSSEQEWPAVEPKPGHPKGFHWLQEKSAVREMHSNLLVISAPYTLPAHIPASERGRASSWATELISTAFANAMKAVGTTWTT